MLMETGEARDLLDRTLRSIRPVDRSWIARAEARQRELTKPPGSLGLLEDMACRLCAIQESLRPEAFPRRIVVFAADHGVAAEGVSAYPVEVTAQMVANFVAGGAAINALARSVGADLRVVDVGVAREIRSIGDRAGFVSRRVREGTRNMTREAAMSEPEVLKAMATGIEEAQRASREEVRVLGLGEMGIANTTAASAVTAVLSGLPPARVAGRGTGLDEPGLKRKIDAIERALAMNRPRGEEPLDALRKVGGLEMAGLAGLTLGAAASRIAVLTDGFIATAAAAVATRIAPASADYLFASHLSTEPAHAVLLELIGRRPSLHLEMSLGEGTGAALAMSLLGAAAAAFNEMATFGSARVSNRDG